MTVESSGDRHEWLTTLELAERLDVRVAHLRSLVASRRIPFAKVGRLVRFHWPSVEAWLTGDGTSSPPRSCADVPSNEVERDRVS